MRVFRWTLALVLALFAVLPAGAPASTPEKRQAVGTLVIGLHAPMTGAVPIPTQSIETAAEVYWEWRRHLGLTIHGRDVQVVVKNDNTNPEEAREVCREMVRQDDVTILAGVLQNAFGSPQIQACAEVARRAGVPYISLGTTTSRLKDNANYFATSMSFRAQGRLLADYFVEELDSRAVKNGVVALNAPHVMEAVRSFKRRIEARNTEIDVEHVVPITAGSGEAQVIATELKTLGIENVFFFATPTFFMQLLQAANNQSYLPMWSGVGITVTNTSSTVMQGCNNGDDFRARFFSPLPSVMDYPEYDPNFGRAMDLLYPMENHTDIAWQGWSTAKQIAQMLLAAGPRWSTKRFISRVEDAGVLRTSAMPELDFSDGDHFGAGKTFVLRASCGEDLWRTGTKYH